LVVKTWTRKWRYLKICKNGTKGTSCNVSVQFHIQIIHEIGLTYGMDHGVDITHWIWGCDFYHLGMTLVMNGKTSTQNKIKFFDKKLKPQKFQERNFVMIYMIIATIERLFKSYFWNWLGHSWLQKSFFDNNTYELAHFNGKEFENINNDKFKHFPQWLNYCSKDVTTK
jgi:hypothetical protein